LLEELLNSVIATYGPVGLLFVMTLQTIIAPIPSEALLIFAGAIGISLFNVTIFGGIGLILGAVIAFFIGRHGGRPIVEKLLGKKWLNSVNGWVDRNGAKSILFTRLIPFIPFDLISYISGMTSLSFHTYLIATVIGAFPRCFILAAMGTAVKDFFSFLGIGIELTFLTGIVGLITIAYLDNRGYLEALKNNFIGRTIKNVFSRKKSRKD